MARKVRGVVDTRGRCTGNLIMCSVVAVGSESGNGFANSSCGPCSSLQLRFTPFVEQFLWAY